MIRVLHPRRLPTGPVLAASTAMLAVAAVLGGLLAADVASPPFQGLDTGWPTSSRLHTPFWDGINAFLNIAGYRGALVLHGVLAVALLARRRPHAAVFTAAAGVAVLIATQVLKAGLERERPQNTVVLTDTGSYPSGHVSATTAFLLVLAVLMATWGWLLASAGMVAMMVSRTYLSAHWLS